MSRSSSPPSRPISLLIPSVLCLCIGCLLINAYGTGAQIFTLSRWSRGEVALSEDPIGTILGSLLEVSQFGHRYFLVFILIISLVVVLFGMMIYLNRSEQKRRKKLRQEQLEAIRQPPDETA